MNDSDSAIGCGRLSGHPAECRYCRYPSPKGRCHGNHFFAFYIWGEHWCHLANTTEPSMCGGDAALCQITLTTCYYYYRTHTRTVQPYSPGLAMCTLFSTPQSTSVPYRCWPLSASRMPGHALGWSFSLFSPSKVPLHVSGSGYPSNTRVSIERHQDRFNHFCMAHGRDRPTDRQTTLRRA